MAAIAHKGRGSVSINRQGAHTRNSARPLDQSVLIGEEGDHGTGWDWSGRRDARHQPFAGVGEDGREGMRVRRRGCLRSIARGSFYFMGLILTRSLLCYTIQSMESVVMTSFLRYSLQFWYLLQSMVPWFHPLKLWRFLQTWRWCPWNPKIVPTLNVRKHI